MQEGRYCFRVRPINWQKIRKDKQWDIMGSNIYKRKEGGGLVFVGKESSLTLSVPSVFSLTSKIAWPSTEQNL